MSSFHSSSVVSLPTLNAGDQRWPNMSTADAIAAVASTWKIKTPTSGCSLWSTPPPSIQSPTTNSPTIVTLALHPTFCDWLLDSLTGRPWSVRIGNRTSFSIIRNTGTPQVCTKAARYWKKLKFFLPWDIYCDMKKYRNFHQMTWTAHYVMLHCWHVVSN